VIDEGRLALFLLLGQTAERVISAVPETLPDEQLLLSPGNDLAALTPVLARRAFAATESFQLFFVFENYLRELMVDALSGDGTVPWWDKVPVDVQQDVAKLETTEEIKAWMALGSRDKSALMTYPQLIRVLEHNWKNCFEDVIRDRNLLNQARLVGHLRNTVAHMSDLPEEEVGRIRQVMRDWFRLVPP
jgi:hypothetical protein